MKFKNYLKLGILAFSISLFLWNCEKEEVNQLQSQLTEMQYIENEFSLKNFKDSFISKNLVVHWDDFISKENIKENKAVYEFNTSLKVKNTIENEKQRFNFKYKVLGFKDDSDRWYFELIKFFANDDKNVNNISYFSPKEFSGTLYHYNLKGESLALKAYKDGKFLNEFSGKGKNNNNLQSKFPSDDGGSQGGGFWMFSRTKHYTDWYRGNGTGGWTYTHSVYNGSTTEYVWVNTGYTGSGNYHNHAPHGGNPATDNHANENIIIDEDFTENYPCQSDIVVEVYGNCSPLSQLFQDIFDRNDNVSVNFTAENLNNIMEGGRTVAITGQPLKYNIKLNSQRLNSSTELDIINTVAHENVHAMLFYFYQAGSFQIEGSGNPTYAKLVEGFSKHRAGFGNDHHPYMASLVNDMAEVTYTWAMENGYNPNDFSDYDTSPTDSLNGLKEFLQKLAWGGLESTTAFNELYPSGTLKRQQILKLIQDEILPNDAGATSKGNLSVPCD
ncbi:hypothetical protein [Hwangdonia sp.]|uniref:hypothetical protein n=1 Tax=Hwangdonia sp. TaxID=1883432 RepID=UPI003AB18DD5